MLFGPCPVTSAGGAILAHSLRAGDRLLRKGRVLSEADLAILLQAGIAQIVVARLEDDDVPEDTAAARIARLAAGASVRVGGAFTGRANLYATVAGLVRINAAGVGRLNAIAEAITLATLAPFARVSAGQMLATVKIIPFAAPRTGVEAVEALLRDGPLVDIAPFQSRRVALISTALPGTKPALLDKNRSALDARLTALGSGIVSEQRVAHDIEALAAAIRTATDADPILILGASAITDRRDVIPAAIEAAGGTIDLFGMPVDPGNLLLAARLDGRSIIGLPSCARSPKINGFDFVLWRLLAGLPVTREEIAAMGVGGLLNEIPTRPQPRDEPVAEAPRLPRIGAVVLAAGLSSRMGANKLLAEVAGKPMVRHAVEAALGSAATTVHVITGNSADALQAALVDLPVKFINNAGFSNGLSTSLKQGISSLPQDCDGALILLADMPDVSPVLIDRLIAAFDPAEGRAICIATRHGKRGNPVLWARRFFPEILALEGDVGAKHLTSLYGELVCEVEAADDAPLTDIDTPEALAAYRTR